MKKAYTFLLAFHICTLTLLVVRPAPTKAVAANTLPHTFLLDPEALATTKVRVQAGDPEIIPALAGLVTAANAALKAGPYSVTDKLQMPPSNDRHDYLSQAPYYWLDPSKPDGLPYVHRDGEHNPEADKIPDHENVTGMVHNVQTLSLAYFLTGDERYAGRTTLRLRTWFLGPKTRMNPNRNYAQFIPGQREGRGAGLIDLHHFDSIGDAIGLLAGSKAWTEADQKEMQTWFGQYLDWLQTSKNGKHEAAAENNQGTFYDTQVIAISLFLGKKNLAQQVALEGRTKRIARQIEPDGRQPMELRRTNAWSYSLFNLQALFDLASLSERAGVNVWHYDTADGRTIRRALDYVIPFAIDPKTWPHKQIRSWSNDGLVPLLYQATIKYKDTSYLDLCRRILRDRLLPDRANLLYAPAWPVSNHQLRPQEKGGAVRSSEEEQVEGSP